MMLARRTGRVVGGLLLLQLVGLFAGFVLLAPAVTTEYLAAAAGLENSVRAAALFLLASVICALLLSIAAFPIFRDNNRGAAFWFIAISVVWLVMQAVDSAHFLSMMSLSKRFAEGGGANADLYSLLAVQVRSTRTWIHYTTLLFIDAWLATLYGSIFAFRLVPRVIGALALLTVIFHAIGLPLAMLIGYPLILNFAYGLPVSYILVGVWLLIKGFSEQNQVPLNGE